MLPNMKKLSCLMLLLPFYVQASMLQLPSYENNEDLKVYIDEDHSNKQQIVITESLYGNKISYSTALNCEHKTIEIPALSYVKTHKIGDEASYKSHLITHACQWINTDKDCNNYLQLEAAYSMLIKSCYNDLELSEFKPHLIRNDFIKLNKKRNCQLSHHISQKKMAFLNNKLKETHNNMKKYCLANKNNFEKIESVIQQELIAKEK